MRVIGMDIGGTHIKAAIVDSAGNLLKEASMPTPVKQGREAILSGIQELIAKLRKLLPGTVEAIGIGSAGRIDAATGRVLYATDNLPGWMGTDLRALIEGNSSLPVFVDNDVNAAARGEGWLGAARESSHYALVTLGTGVGGALVHNGRIIPGSFGGAGEIGHLILHPRGLPCNCGQSGCLEQYVSGTALNRMARAADEEWNSYILMERLVSADPLAIQIMEQFSQDLAIGLASLQQLYDPERILLGGGLMDTYPLWRERLGAHLRAVTPSNLTIIPAQLGNKAGMLGAARMAWDYAGAVPLEYGQRRESN